MNLSLLRLITFDVTDTLLVSSRSLGMVYAQIAKKNGVDVTKEEITTHFRLEWEKLVRQNPNYGRWSNIGYKEWWFELVKRTFLASDPSIPQAKIDVIIADLVVEYTKPINYKLIDGTYDFLTYLKQHPVKLGVISNYDPTLTSVLEMYKMKHYFDFVVTSYESGYEKPNPIIFNFAKEKSKLEHLLSKHCLHIGNSFHLDYKSALAATWNAILIRRRDKEKFLDRHPDVPEDRVFEDLHDLHVNFLQQNANDEKV